MYTQYFSLKQSPFSIAPDPRYLYMSERHREALAHLLYGVNGGGGFVLLTGEIGAGKTTVCRCFMEQIPANCQLAYIFNPSLSVEELLRAVCDEFGIGPTSPRPGMKTYVDAINAHLLRSHAQGKNNVLIIDEAQNLSAEVLEQLRLLTNLETSERKLLQIILIGQPELRAMLARPELEQLAQRVIARYHLGPLSAAETAGYVGHRLKVAGAAAMAPFPPGLLRRIHRLSKGVPRRINLLCDRALLGAYVENRAQVTRKIVDRAASEVFGAPDAAPVAGRRWAYLAAGLLAGALVTGASLWRWLPQAPQNMSKAAAPREGALPPSKATALPAAAPPSAPQSFLAPLDEDAALRQLALLWGVTLPRGQACQAAVKMQLRCYRGKGGLDELRLLDRPSALLLRAEADGAAPPLVLLTGLNEDRATLRAGGAEQSLGAAQLAPRLAGEFITFRRAPAGWREEIGEGDRGDDVDWLAQRLADLNGVRAPREGRPFSEKMAGLLRHFQIAQNLKADGMAGPKTFIRLTQLDGDQEPRLSGQAAASIAATGK
jgi:general secretion pathway protein A